MASITPIADNIHLRIRALEAEHTLMRATLDSLRVPEGSPIPLEAIEQLAGENAKLREENKALRLQAQYEDWFESMFRVRVLTPNTFPFTTWSTGTAWGDKAAFGLQDAEILFAEHLLETLEADGIVGAIVEFGTYYGHWVHVLVEILERRGWHREIWGFDSFEGLPAPQAGVDPTYWSQGQYAAPFEEVKLRLEVAKRPWLHLVKGWFNESLVAEPALSVGPIAYARVDGDLYSSCVDCLAYLGPRLVQGAILVFDDWQFDQTIGEPRAFGEWMAANPGWEFEYLGMNLWAHLYLRVTKRPR